MNKAREEVENKLKDAPHAASASTSMPRLSLTLADNVLGLLLKHSQFRGRVGELERSITQKLKDQEDKLEDTGMILKWQDEAIRGLAMSTKVLEGFALGVRRPISLIASTNRTSLARRVSRRSGYTQASWRCSLSSRSWLYGGLSNDLSRA